MYVWIFKVTIFTVKGKLFELPTYYCFKLANLGAIPVLLSSTFTIGYV